MILTEEQIADKLEEVKKIKFFLDPDPSTLGLSSISIKLAEIQIHKDRVSSLIMEAMKNVSELEITKETTQNEHDRKLDLLIATDEDVKNQKSAEARNIHARTKMTDLVLKLHHADIGLIKGTWYLKCLQLVASNLESANSNLSRQITVLQMDQNLGGGSGINRGTIKNINI